MGPACSWSTRPDYWVLLHRICRRPSAGWTEACLAVMFLLIVAIDYASRLRCPSQSGKDARHVVEILGMGNKNLFLQGTIACYQIWEKPIALAKIFIFTMPCRRLTHKAGKSEVLGPTVANVKFLTVVTASYINYPVCFAIVAHEPYTVTDLLTFFMKIRLCFCLPYW